MAKHRAPFISKHAKTRRTFLTQGIGLLGVLITDRFSRGWSAEENSRVYKLAPESVLAPDIRRAAAEVREAYRFAVANQEVLRYIPCYCGCGSEGHTSNASCYLKEGSKPGNLIFDRMSLN
jgi:hypothetical protein